MNLQAVKFLLQQHHWKVDILDLEVSSWMTAFSFKINIKVSVCGFERDDPGE